MNCTDDAEFEQEHREAYIEGANVYKFALFFFWVYKLGFAVLTHYYEKVSFT